MDRDEVQLARRFDAERPRLRAIATRLLGSPADADDVVQEAWLRLARVDPDELENLPAWLTTVVSRIGLDRLRAPSRTRTRPWEVQAWPDEPASQAADPADVVAEGDRIHLALQLVLERLSPPERVAFLLHDVFGEPFERIAGVLDRSTDAVRQLASRGRRRVREGEDASSGRRRDRRVVDAWLAAVEAGDFRRLIALLDPDAVLRADFGARTQLVEGVDAIVQQALLAARLAAHSIPVLIDGVAGVAAVIEGRVVSLMAFTIDVDVIRGLDVLADARRLGGLALPPDRAAGGGRPD